MLIASTAIFPTPSHIKMDSTMAVPPRRLPTDSIRSVMIVTRKLSSHSPQCSGKFDYPCFRTNHIILAPIHPVPLLLPDEDTSHSWQMASVIAGIATLFRLTPVAMTGNQPSRMENRYISKEIRKVWKTISDKTKCSYKIIRNMIPDRLLPGFPAEWI